MQHKRRGSTSKVPNGKIMVAALAVVVVGVLAALMTADVPVEQKPVEQALDAKTFLASKPAE